MEVKGGQSTSQTAAQLGKSVKDKAGSRGGGCFVSISVNVLLLAAGGGWVRQVDIMVWMVKWHQ